MHCISMADTSKIVRTEKLGMFAPNFLNIDHFSAFTYVIIYTLIRTICYQMLTRNNNILSDVY